MSFWFALLAPLTIKLGIFLSEIYVETKFEEVRWGPHGSIDEVDHSLSWFRREEIAESLIAPYYLRGPNIESILKQSNLKFVSYYVGRFGFVVIYDEKGDKLSQIKTNI